MPADSPSAYSSPTSTVRTSRPTACTRRRRRRAVDPGIEGWTWRSPARRRNSCATSWPGGSRPRP